MEGESPRLFAWLNGANEAPSQAELFAQVSQLQRTVQALTDELMELRKERRAPHPERADAQTQVVFEEPEKTRPEKRDPKPAQVAQPTQPAVPVVTGNRVFSFGTGKKFKGRIRSTGDAMRDFLIMDFAGEARLMGCALQSCNMAKHGGHLLGVEADHVPEYSSQFLERRWLKSWLYQMGKKSQNWRPLGRGRVAVEDGIRVVFERKADVVTLDTNVVEARAKQGRPVATFVATDGEKSFIEALRFRSEADRDVFMGWLRVKKV